jgi:Uma2 family endonuclease
MSSATQHKPQLQEPYITLAEYFDFESKSTTRHEYQDGLIVEMAYASDNHELIVANLMRELGVCLKDSDCLIYPSNRMLYVKNCNKTFYPDVSIYCGQRETYQYSKNMTALLNPSVLIEVLSPSTERDDKDKKWRCYKRIPSLKQYILIAQDEIFVRILNRTSDDNKWLQSEFDLENEVIKVGDCEISLKEIFRNTDIPKGERASDV